MPSKEFWPTQNLASQLGAAPEMPARRKCQTKNLEKIFQSLLSLQPINLAMNLMPSQFDTLSKMLDVATLRHQVLAQNIANVNTPGYKRLDIKFEDQLAERLDKNKHAEAANLQPEVFVDESGAFRADGNNVEIDLEVGRLNKNALLQKTYAQVLTMRLSQMRSAISAR